MKWVPRYVKSLNVKDDYGEEQTKVYTKTCIFSCCIIIIIKQYLGMAKRSLLYVWPLYMHIISYRPT